MCPLLCGILCSKHGLIIYPNSAIALHGSPYTALALALAQVETMGRLQPLSGVHFSVQVVYNVQYCTVYSVLYTASSTVYMYCTVYSTVVPGTDLQ